MPRPTFYNCDRCLQYHEVGFSGECGPSKDRFTLDSLNRKYGKSGWTEKMPDGSRPRFGIGGIYTSPCGTNFSAGD